MSTGKIIIGAILIVIAIYLFISIESFAGRFVGGGILAILGLAEIITGIIKNGEKNGWFKN